MTRVTKRLALASSLLLCAHVASAQTADQVVEKSLAALGGRAALVKLKTRASTGTITLLTPLGEVSGSIETFNAAPNKSRTLIKADLSSLGAGPLVLDQRFDGKSGYIMDSLQGNREMSGGQLEALKNGSFPHPFLNYKEMGASVTVSGKEKVGERDAYLLLIEHPTGPVVRLLVDAESYLPVKTIIKVEVPQLGRDVEQSTEMLDYREVDGIKLPYRLKVSSSVQNFTVEIAKIEHNVPIDDALFSKPATP